LDFAITSLIKTNKTKQNKAFKLKREVSWIEFNHRPVRRSNTAPVRRGSTEAFGHKSATQVMTLEPKTFNIQHPTFNIQVTDAGKPGGSALNVECSMFVREICGARRSGRIAV
jgi:hypothetical protein